MLPDITNSDSDRSICLSYHCCYGTDHIIMYLDIIMTIMILVYFPTWVVCVILENSIFWCQCSILFLPTVRRVKIDNNYSQWGNNPIILNKSSPETTVDGWVCGWVDQVEIKLTSASIEIKLTWDEAELLYQSFCKRKIIFGQLPHVV